MKNSLRSCILLLLLSAFVYAQENPGKSPSTVKELAQSVAGGEGTAFEKTDRLVKWINTNFKWTYTDYQKRTVDEIIQRRGGNCAELANVLFALLQEAGIQARWIAEINVQPKSERRQNNAEDLVRKVGLRGSVFGLMHNDHRWLEVYDESRKSWFPADPAVGVVGLRDWVLMRLGFGARPASPVPEMANITKDMIAPFVVLAMESKGGNPKEERSEFYLIDGFNRVYDRKLAGLPSWKAWVAQIQQLSPLASSTFKGETNLHQQGALIERLAQVYERLRQEALERKLKPTSQLLY
jgi:hypothetical protein